MTTDIHRQSLLDLLALYQPWDEADRGKAAQLKEFVINEPQCLNRACVRGHVTGSAWLVNAAGDHVLLTHHRKLGMWLQLGGHMEFADHVIHTALREAKEESGIEDIVPLSSKIFDIDIHSIPAYKSDPAHLHYDVRFALMAMGMDYKVSEESQELAWIEIEKIIDKTSEPSLLRMAAKWQVLKKDVNAKKPPAWT